MAIVQDDRFDATDSVTVCAFTTDPTDAPLFRLRIEPDDGTACESRAVSWSTRSRPFPAPSSAHAVGRLSDEEMVRLGRAILVFLGLAG